MDRDEHFRKMHAAMMNSAADMKGRSMEKVGSYGDMNRRATTMEYPPSRNVKTARDATEIAAFLKGLSAKHLAKRGIASQNLNLRWREWLPKFRASGSMTFTSPTTELARYLLMDSICFVNLRASGTTGGTGDKEIWATLPVAPKELRRDRASMSGYAADGSNTVMCFSYIEDGALYLATRRYDSANWSLGTSRTINVSGFYEVADEVRG